MDEKRASQGRKSIANNLWIIFNNDFDVLLVDYFMIRTGGLALCRTN